MSCRHGWMGLAAWSLLLGLAGPATSRTPAQEVAAEPAPARLDPVEGHAPLPSDVQVVRFVGPAGVLVEVLGPPPEIVPVGDAQGLATVGLKVGVGYQLRLTHLPGREGAELYPYVELVGHLHRPAAIDPAKYPIRIPLSEEDFSDVLDRGQMVTKVIYLEAPEQALPLAFPKEEIPVVTLGAAEHPVQVAAALGRVVALVRLGNRTPTVDDLGGAVVFGLAGGRCPFSTPERLPCALPCGPACGTPPPPGRLWLPRDEYLCDGGDFHTPAHFAGDGGLAGIDPRDAVLRFRDDRRPRILPTNLVCIYAPRFAAVRSRIGPGQTQTVQNLFGTEQLQQQAAYETRQGPKRLTQNRAAEIHRHRSRPSGLVARVGIARSLEVKVLSATDAIVHVAGHVQSQAPETAAKPVLPVGATGRVRLDAIKTGEGPVVEGIAEGPGQQVMAWKPQELAAVEYPPNKPGMAVVKQVDVAEAQPGDVVTYTITYRNIGNVPITAVSVVDSLLPRLEYLPGSARGPAGAVFTAAENHVGSTELRWDIGTVPPGHQGAVSFQARVR